jgi:hypothetical protein
LVNFTKWVVIAAGLVGLGLFTQEAAASGLTGTLQRTGLAGSTIGSGIGSIGQGIGSAFSGVLAPFWEIRNIVRGFMNMGSATPWLEDAPNQGGGTTENTGDGGGTEPIPLSIIQGVPDVYSGGGFSYYNDRVISPSPVTDVQVTWQGGQTRDLPLSAAAIQHYQNAGVQISRPDGGGISEISGGGGGSAVTNTSGGGNPLGAAHAAGYSLGSA